MAAKQTNETGGETQVSRSYLSRRSRGVVIVVVVVVFRRQREEVALPTVGSVDWIFSLGGHVGSSIIIIIIEASNLDEGQGLGYQPLREPYTV